MFTRLVASSVLVLLAAALTSADVIHVPGEHASIGQALDAASDGDIVLVQPGTYIEAIDFGGKDVTVISSDGPASTKILAGGPGSLVSFRQGESRAAALVGFTLEGGTGSMHQGRPVGGAVFCENASPTLLGNVFHRNIGASSGGAVYLWGSSSPALIGNEFTSNRSIAAGGAIAILGALDSYAEILDCRFRSNSTSNQGAAIYSFGSVSVVDCVFRENDAPAGQGGAVVIHAISGAGSARVMGNRFIGNRVQRHVLLLNSGNETASIIGNRFESNIGTVGPQIELISFGLSRFERNIVVRNRTTPAIATQGTAILSSNLVAWNQGGNAVLRHSKPGEVRHINGTVVANVAPFHVETSVWTDVFVADSIVYAPGRQLWLGAPTSVESCIVSQVPPGETLIEDLILEDPRFVDIDHDLHLRIDSPAVDRGRSGGGGAGRSLVDIDGDGRSVGGRPGELQYTDIGADEMIPELAARYGSVGASTARIEDVLLANGTAGSRNTREVFLRPQEPITIEMRAPSSGPEIAPFALYAWNGEPDILSIVEQPVGLGWTGFATPLQGARPSLVWNNIGHFPRLGMPDLDSTPAPSTVFVRTNGLGVGRVVTLQGIIADDGSAADTPASVTNAITLRVLD